MKEKCKAIAWSGLYLVIELASLTLLSFILSFIVMVAGIQLGMFSADQMQNFQGVLAKLIQYIQQGNPLMILNFVQELITLACFGLWYYFREKKYQYRPNYKKAFSIKNVLSIAGIAFCLFLLARLQIFLIVVVHGMPPLKIFLCVNRRSRRTPRRPAWRGYPPMGQKNTARFA